MSTNERLVQDVLRTSDAVRLAGALFVLSGIVFCAAGTTCTLLPSTRALAGSVVDRAFWAMLASWLLGGVAGAVFYRRTEGSIHGFGRGLSEVGWMAWCAVWP